MTTSQPKPSGSTNSTDTSAGTKTAHHWGAWAAIIGGAAIFVVAGLTGVAYASQARTIVRGSQVAGQDVGGLTSLDAIHRVQQQWTAFTAGAFHFRLDQQDIIIPTAAASPSTEEVVLDLTSLDISKAVNEAYDYGHAGPWWVQARQRLSGWIGHHHQFGQVGIDKTSLADGLHQQVKQNDHPPINAGLTMVKQQVTDIVPSQDGQSIDYSGALAEAVQRAKHLDTTPVSLRITTTHPAVVSAPSLQSLAEEQVPELLKRAPLTLTYGDKKWTLDANQLAKIFGFSTNPQGQVRVGFDAAKTAAYLQAIGKDINVAPQNAKLTLESGQVREFQTSIVGLTLNPDASLASMEKYWLDEGQTAVPLVVDQTQPATSALAANNLGITELVAEATTNFKGSPTNRRYNIGLGARILNGLLIAPGETFSLVKALGPIDKTHGWKPELVIKGSDILPEFGGGLCQVATTTFRVALNAGLPIVERHNHSLRIRYYEPPVGLDATIYEPRPDLRFTNDYGHYLLLQTEVVGNDLTFRFYGTKDTRTVDIPTPKVFNKTAIPATKNIEVDDLKPGQKECQTPGHPGADAIATYIVTKADGTKVKQTFTSHYRALGVICRVGKKAAPKPTNTAQPTNTNSSDITLTNQ